MSEEIRYPQDYKESELFKLYPDLYESIFVHKRNVLISGMGGTGKSYTIGMIKREFNRLNIICDLTSTTGVSAHALGYGASTLHRWSSIKLGKDPAEVILKNIRQAPDKLKRWKNCECLVIDEVSMLGSSILELVSKLGQEIRIGRKEMKRLFSKKIPIPPFGGLQVIFSGDFLQLQPINDKFAFESLVWPRLNLYIFKLSHPYRYPDIKHFEMLARIRLGEHTAEDINMLRTRVVAYEEYRRKERAGELKENIKPTRIYPLKRDVEAINISELQKLEGDTIVYEAEDTIMIKTTKDGVLVIHPDSINTNDYSEYMDSIVSSEILMKPGAQVMLTKNLSVEEGLTNGSRGVVLECHDERIVVEFKCGMIVDIIPHPYEFSDDKVDVVRHQFPLILADAVTCHKQQGSTLDYAIIDLGTSLFCSGLGYVMLSRCKTLEGILIINLMPKMIYANETALEFEKSLVKEATSETKLIQKESVEDTDKIVDHLAYLALEIEEKVGCKHSTGISIICKLCKIEKIKSRTEYEQTEPGNQ